MMDDSPLTVVEFTILGLVMEQPLPAESLRDHLVDRLGWTRLERGLFVTISRMKKRGLLHVSKDLAIDTHRTRQQSRYFSTARGRALWNQMHALLSVLCMQWTSLADQTQPIDFPAIENTNDDVLRRSVRLPEERELATILRESTPEFALLFRVAMMTGECIVSLSQLTIDNVKVDEGQLRFATQDGPRTVVVSCNALKAISEAAAGRTDGAVFLTSSGLPWKEENCGWPGDG
jgi:hypothetical protein